MQLETGTDIGRYQAGRRDRSSVEPIAMSDLESPEVRAIEHAWQRWRGFHAMPAREGLIPRDLGRFMTNVSLVQVLDDGEDYEFRIIGDAHLRAYGSNFMGKYMRDVIAIAPRFGRLLKASFDLVRTTGRPYAFHGVVGYDAPDTRFSSFETCYLPFGAGQNAVTHILNAASYSLRGES